MAKNLVWNTDVTSLEEGKELWVSGSGAAPHEQITIHIQKPDSSYFVFGIKSGADGRFNEPIMLDSGLGTYILCLDPQCGVSDPTCRKVDLCPCQITSSNKCNIIISGPSRVLRGQKVPYEIVGLRPSRYVSVRISSNTQGDSYLSGVSDLTGKLIFELEQNTIGAISLTFSDGECLSNPYIVDIIGSMNEVPKIIAVDSNYCATPTDINLRFDRSAYQPGESGSLRMTIKNNSAYGRLVSLAMEAIAPGATMQNELFPQAVDIPGYGTKEFAIYFSAGQQDAIYSARVSGSYICGGLTYAVNGAAAIATIGNGTGYCNPVLQFFGATSGGTAVKVGDEAEISVTILNAGNVPIVRASVNQITMPENSSIVANLPIIEDILPGESKTGKFKVKFTKEGSYTIHMPSGGLTYTCSSGEPTTPLRSPGFVTFSVTKDG